MTRGRPKIMNCSRAPDVAAGSYKTTRRQPLTVLRAKANRRLEVVTIGLI